MPRRTIGLLALGLAAALTLAGLSAAGPAAKKQRVVVNQLEKPGRGTFKLEPDPGPIATDKGAYTWTHKPPVTSTRDGQRFKRYDSKVTFVGKNGTFVVREIATLVAAATTYEIATGTWEVLRGTGAYEGVTGGGRLGAIIGVLDPSPWRYEGFLISP